MIVMKVKRYWHGKLYYGKNNNNNNGTLIPWKALALAKASCYVAYRSFNGSQILTVHRSITMWQFASYASHLSAFLLPSILATQIILCSTPRDHYSTCSMYEEQFCFIFISLKWDEANVMWYVLCLTKYCKQQMVCKASLELWILFAYPPEWPVLSDAADEEWKRK